MVALGQDAQSLNPLVAGDVWSVRAYTPLYPQLYEVEADLSVRPSLAAALPEISADGLTWSVRLRPAHWSDGRPISADDVVYTVQAEMDPALDTRATFDWSPLQRVEKVDATTVRFHLARPDGAFLANRLPAPIVPQHALQGVPLGSMSTALFSTQPSVAGGPFRLRLRTPGVSIGMGANSQSLGPKPYLDVVDMLVIPDQNRLETQIAQGNVTWAPDIPAAVAAQLRGNPNVTVRSFQELGRYSLVFNTRAGRPFAGHQAREALQMVLDHRKIAAAADGVPVATGINPASWGYVTVGTSADGSGGPAHGELLIPLGDPARQAAAAEVVREAAATGITLTPKAVLPAEFQARLRSGDFDSALAGLGEGADPDPEAAVASWEAPGADAHGQNFSGLADPQLDALLKRDLAADPWDHATRRPLLAEIEGRIAQDVPYIDLWSLDELDAFSASLTDPGPVAPQLDQALQSSFYARWSLSA